MPHVPLRLPSGSPVWPVKQVTRAYHAPLLFDVHVPLAVANQLELRGVDILTAQADNSATLQDQDILVRATELGRVMFTSDIRFRALAETWQQSQRIFHGLVFAHPLHVTVGQMVLHLELIASAVSEEEIRNQVIYLPL